MSFPEVALPLLGTLGNTRWPDVAATMTGNNTGVGDQRAGTVTEGRSPGQSGTAAYFPPYKPMAGEMLDSALGHQPSLRPLGHGTLGKQPKARSKGVSV